jgi:S-adenosyl-L-methionine hydrolase (adenosine-forming)
LTIITLMTDFGLKDGNVGVMKGVIARIAPQAQVIDLSHLIGPQNIPEAALILLRSAPYFPDGSIHVVVVDPGVGTTRRPLAARMGSQYYIGPDNGTLTLWLERLEAQGQPVTFYHLNNPEFWLLEVSHVFHGRDIFAPVAAHLASGIPIEQLGSSVSDPVRLDLPRPQPIPGGLRGRVIHIDHFGNLATNIRVEHLPEDSNITVSLCGVIIPGMVDTFGERSPGSLVALLGSTGNLIVSVVNGNAADYLHVQVGDIVDVTFPSRAPDCLLPN